MVQYLTLMRKFNSNTYILDMRLYHRLFFTLILAATALVARSQSATFTFQTSNGFFCEPTVVNFTQTASGTPSGFSWNFGNGTFSNAANPNATYTSAGTYTVTLVTIYDNSTSQSSQTITINPTNAVALSANRPYICRPGNITFTANSTGTLTNYLFDFGDGSAPVTTASNTVTHFYNAFGNFTATVIATSPFGCTSTSGFAVSVRTPTLTGMVSPTSGCVPALVTFNLAAALPIGSFVSSYNWNYGDGVTQTTSSASTSHNYPTVGTYLPSVNIVTNEGCTANFNYQSIAFGRPPVGLVAYTPKPVICGSETAVLIAKADTANSFLWNYGDGITQTVTDTITSHKYTTLGTFTVTVIPYFNGCAGQSRSFTVSVIGVIVGFNYANTCSNKNTYIFTNTSQGNVSSYNWTFGDGSPAVTTANTVHTYPTSGSFPTNLSIADNTTGCTDNLQVNIFTATPNLLNPDTAICRYSASTFSIFDNYDNPNNTYNWTVLGQTFTNQNAPSTFNANILGNFNQNYVVINYGAQSCSDTVRLNRPILVRGPVIDFNIATSICARDSVSFTNNSRPFISSDSIVLYYWNYGTSNFNDTTFQPRPRVFNNAGAYNIKLVGIDKNGCKDSLLKVLTVNPLPYLLVIPQQDTLCLGQQTRLIAFHTDMLTWSNAITLSCATCDTTFATPTMSTNYVATATSSFGCVSTDTSRILVFSPFTASINSKSDNVCAGDSLQLNAFPPGKIIRWSPPTAISDTTVYNPVIRPPSTTNYTAILTDSVGCYSSSASIRIIVKSNPTINAGPDLILPYASTVTLAPMYSANIVSYSWTPPTNLNCNTCPTPIATALITQLYVVTAISDSGCIARDSIKIIVQCKDANMYLPTAFTPNGDRRNDYFYPLTRGISIITKFVVFNRYGNTVFSRANFVPNVSTLGWDGRIKNLPQDQTGYVYIMEAICDQGQKLVKKGSFILIR